MKILVISSNLIGDTILSTGVIQHFLNTYPNCRFTFVIGPTASQLYDHLPNLEKRIIVEKKKYNFHWIDIYRSCFNNKWDVIIDFRSSIISYLIFCNKRFIFKKRNKLHHIEQLNHCFKFNCSNLFIYTSEEEDLRVKKSIQPDYKYIALSPGGNWIPKIWSIKNFNKMIKMLIKTNNKIKFIIVGSLGENYYLNDMLVDIDKNNIINLMGEKLTQTSAYMKMCNLFIGNDSGLMHLAAASNTPTIGLFGPTNDKIYSPMGNKCFVIRTKENYNFFKNKKLNPKNSYMESIKPDEVVDFILKNNFIS